jgi:uncharacterized protein
MKQLIYQRKDMITETTIKDEQLQADQAAAEAYLKYVHNRRSVRKLANGPVSDETIRTILEAGRWSPSSANTQPVRIILLKERHHELWEFIEHTLKTKLQDAQLERALNRLPGYQAGVFSLVFYEDTTIANNPPAGVDPNSWKSFATQAIGMAQINVWNAIAAAGLAASNQHINLQMEAELRSFLDIPSTWNSYSIFPVGYPAETPQEGTRHAYENFIFSEHGPSI